VALIVFISYSLCMSVHVAWVGPAGQVHSRAGGGDGDDGYDSDITYDEAVGPPPRRRARTTEQNANSADHDENNSSPAERAVGGAENAPAFSKDDLQKLRLVRERFSSPDESVFVETSSRPNRWDTTDLGIIRSIAGDERAGAVTFHLSDGSTLEIESVSNKGVRGTHAAANGTINYYGVIRFLDSAHDAPFAELMWHS